MARYRLLADHYVGSFLEAGSIATTGVELPENWTPSTAVDPIDGDAIQSLFDAGPRGQGAEPWTGIGPFFTGGHWTNKPIAGPQIFWQPVPNYPGAFQLTAGGAFLGQRSAP